MRSNDGRTLALALLALAGSALPTTASAALVRPIRFEHLSLEEGLSQAAVMDVLQDRRGYIWLATEDGLNRFDGLMESFGTSTIALLVREGQI